MPVANDLSGCCAGSVSVEPMKMVRNPGRVLKGVHQAACHFGFPFFGGSLLHGSGCP